MIGRLTAGVATAALTLALAAASADAGVSATMSQGAYDGCTPQLAAGADDSGPQYECRQEQPQQLEAEQQEPKPCPVNQPPADDQEQQNEDEQQGENEQQNEQENKPPQTARLRLRR